LLLFAQKAGTPVLKKLNPCSQNQLIDAGFTKNGVEIQQKK
jgi:hypothetical protein